MPELKDIILGNVAVERGLVSRDTLSDLQKQQRETGLPLGQVMLRAGVVSGPRLIELMKLVNVTIQHLDGGMEVGIDDADAGGSAAPAAQVNKQPAPVPAREDEIPVVPVYGSGGQQKPAAAVPRPPSIRQPAAQSPGGTTPRTGIPTPKPMPAPQIPPAVEPAPRAPAAQGPKTGTSQRFDPSKIQGTATPGIMRPGTGAPVKAPTSRFDSSRFDAPAMPPAPAQTPAANKPATQRFGVPSKTAPAAKTQGFGSANMRRVGTAPADPGQAPAAMPPANPPEAGRPDAAPPGDRPKTSRFEAPPQKPPTVRFEAGKIESAPQTNRPLTRRFEAPPQKPPTNKFEAGKIESAPQTNKPLTRRFEAPPKPPTGRFEAGKIESAPQTNRPLTRRFEAPPQKQPTDRFEQGKIESAPQTNRPLTRRFEAPPAGTGKPVTRRFEASRPKTEQFKVEITPNEEQVKGSFGESLTTEQKKKDPTLLNETPQIPEATPAGKLPPGGDLPLPLPAPPPSTGPVQETLAGRLPAGIDADTKPLASPLDDSKIISPNAPPFELPASFDVVSPPPEAGPAPVEKAPEPVPDVPVAPAVPAIPVEKTESPGRQLRPEDSGFIAQSEIPDFEVRAADAPGEKPVVVTNPKPAEPAKAEPPKKESRRMPAAAKHGVRPGPGARPPAAAGKAPAPAAPAAKVDAKPAEEPPKKRSKKLFVSLLIVLALVLAGGGALFFFKKLTVKDLERLPEAFRQAPELLKEAPKLLKELFKK